MELQTVLVEQQEETGCLEWVAGVVSWGMPLHWSDGGYRSVGPSMVCLRLPLKEQSQVCRIRFLPWESPAATLFLSPFYS